MAENRMLIDTFNNRAYLIGEGGYDIHLSPGSIPLRLRRAETGHLMLPMAEWAKHKPSVDNRHVSFMTNEKSTTPPVLESAVQHVCQQSSFLVMADERRKVQLTHATLFTAENCIMADVTRPIWLAADSSGLSRRNASNLAERIMSFASRCSNIVIDAGSALARRIRLRSMKPLHITLALLSVLCVPTVSAAESEPPQAIEVLTNMTFSPSSACILPAESPAVLNSVLWNTQEVDAQLNIIHHVYSAMTSKTAETESSKKKNRKKKSANAAAAGKDEGSGSSIGDEPPAAAEVGGTQFFEPVEEAAAVNQSTYDAYYSADSEDPAKAEQANPAAPAAAAPKQAAPKKKKGGKR
jgi:hypothetical protein